MNVTRTEKLTVMSGFFKYSVISLNFMAQYHILYSEGEK